MNQGYVPGPGYAWPPPPRSKKKRQWIGAACAVLVLIAGYYVASAFFSSGRNSGPSSRLPPSRVVLTGDELANVLPADVGKGFAPEWLPSGWTLAYPYVPTGDSGGTIRTPAPGSLSLTGVTCADLARHAADWLLTGSAASYASENFHVGEDEEPAFVLSGWLPGDAGKVLSAVNSHVAACPRFRARKTGYRHSGTFTASAYPDRVSGADRAIVVKVQSGTPGEQGEYALLAQFGNTIAILEEPFDPMASSAYRSFAYVVSTVGQHAFQSQEDGG